MSQIIKMDTIILYHGSPNKIVTPVFGGGDDKHDYGRGFYLTENIDLAKVRRDFLWHPEECLRFP